MARHAAKEANPLYPVPVLMDAGELQSPLPYEDLVNTTFAEQVAN